jgi:ABC-2 type transport system ATP-binding protein
MRQRLGLAAVLLGDPHTVVLDEPANGLDPEGIRWIRDLLRYLADQQRTVLVSSHLLSEMALMANELVVIGQGRLIEQCSVESFVSRYAQRWVRVQSPALPALVRHLAGSGGFVTPVDDTTAEVQGLSAAEVGEAAAALGVVLHELSIQTGSLEDAYLRATTGTEEYGARPIGGAW